MKASTENDWKSEFAETTVKGLGSFGNFLTTLVSVLSLAGAVSWFYVSQYYKAFGAEWILQDISVYTLMQLGLGPSLMLGCLSALTFKQILDLKTFEYKLPWLVRHYLAVGGIFILLLLANVILVDFFSSFGWSKDTAGVISFIVSTAFLLFALAACRVLLFTFHSSIGNRDATRVYAFFFFILFGVWAYPSNLGLAMGKAAYEKPSFNLKEAALPGKNGIRSYFLIRGESGDGYLAQY